MTKLVALKSHRIRGRLVKPGDTYEVGGQEERLCRALGWSEDAPRQVEELPRVTAQAQDEEKPAAKRPYVRTGKYSRRDMQATQGASAVLDESVKQQDSSDTTDSDSSE